MAFVEDLRRRARALKSDTYALYLAARHPGTPWNAKVLAAAVAAYAFSPIDLIPDLVPVLGYLDDLIIVPLGIAASIRLVPENVMSECRARAAQTLEGDRPVSRTAAVVVVVVWLAAAVLILYPLTAKLFGP